MACLEVFDKSNKQRQYQVMAKDLNDKWVIGWVVIKKPWYSSKGDWTYYVYSNNYKAGGMCGGSIDLGIKNVVVNPNTIIPFNQVASVVFNQSIGQDTILCKERRFGGMGDEDNVVRRIKHDDEIPYDLWD